MRRLGHFGRGVAALGLLAVLIVGLPLALWHFIGWPLPHAVPDWDQLRRGLDQHGIPDQVLIKALAVVVWVTWLILLISVVVEVPAAFAGREAHQVRFVGLFQPLTGRLVAVVVFSVLALAPGAAQQNKPGSLAGTFTNSNRSAPTLLVSTTLSDASWPISAPGSAPTPMAKLPEVATPIAMAAVPSTSVATSAVPASTYVVERGDTLWAIAQRQLGNPLRWSEIFQLNEGHIQHDGRTLSDPHWIDPGWKLILPSADATPPVSAVVTPTPIPAPVPSTVPVPPANQGGTSTKPPSPSRSGASKAEPTAPVSARSARGNNQQTVPASHLSGASNAPIQLLSGSVIAGTFGAGVLAAMAAGRLRRRRHYHPNPPRPGRHLDPKVPSAGLRDLLAAESAPRHSEEEEVTTSVRRESAPMTAIPDDDALVHPDVIEVASRGAEVICLALCEWPGLVIKGSGAASSLRAWLAALLARNGPFGAEVLMVDPLGGGLFPGIELPGLRRIETVEAALLRLERAILDRGQRLDDAGVHDVASHRRQAPEYPLPLLLCVTDVIPARLGLRWLAMCAAAEKMGLGALVLASEPDEERELDHVAHLEIGEDGLAASVGPAGLAGLLEGSRPFQLSAEDAVDLLAPVALIHNDHEFDEPDVGEDGDVRTVDAVERCRTGPSLHEVHDGDFVCWPDPATHEVASAPILVEVFGPAVVEAWGEKITSGLRANAYELLAWYVLHPDGATAEAAIDALWPDASPKRGRERFWTALGNLRTRLSGPGEEKVQILAKVGDHYGPDSSMLDVDLWRFEAALREATQTNEVTKMVAALERACSTYGGEFYPSGDALWVEPVREDLHRRALDAHIRLAELHADEGRPEAAISTLERTIEIDSICEEAYRRLIVLQTALGHTDAAQRTWQLLQRELADLDLEPESATVNLIGDVLSPRRSMVRDLAPVQGRST